MEYSEGSLGVIHIIGDPNDGLDRLIRTVGYQVLCSPLLEEAGERSIQLQSKLVVIHSRHEVTAHIDMVQRIRMRHDVPIVLVSSSHEQHNRLAAYRAGVDDYIAANVSAEELVLRVGRVLSRAGSAPVMVKQRHIQVGGLSISRDDNSIAFGVAQVDLTPVQFELLWLFVQNPKVIFKKAYLYQEILQKPYQRHDRSLDMHVSNLRSKLKQIDAAEFSITTVHGQGYCFG